MSDAKVRFHTLNEEADAEPGREQSFSFNCPKWDRRCGDLIIRGRTGLKQDPQGQNGGVAQWGWDGNRTAPTFTPSVMAASAGTDTYEPVALWTAKTKTNRKYLAREHKGQSMRAVALLAFVALSSPAFAQAPTDRVKLDVSRAELQIIGQGLMELPYKNAAGVMNTLQAQLNAADHAAAKAAEDAKKKPEEKPAEVPAEK